MHARLLEPRKDIWNLRKRLKRQVKVHQPIAQARLVQRQSLQGEIERVGRDLPKIRMPALKRPQPRVLQLLVTPERGQGIDGLTEDIAAAFGG